MSKDEESSPQPTSPRPTKPQRAEPQSPSDSEDALRFRKNFLLVLALGISLAFLATIQTFLMALLMAAILTGLCQPVHRRVLAWVGGRHGLASALTVFGLLIVLVIPSLLFMGLVTAQALEVSEIVTPWVTQQVQKGSLGTDYLERINLPEAFQPYEGQVVAKLGEFTASAGRFLIAAVASATRGTVQFLFMLFVTLYATFFFLMNGRAALDRILHYMPLESKDEHRLLDRFASVSRATLKGTLVIGAVQGGLAGAALALAGIPGAAFWGTIMALLSIVPGVGTALVWVPAVIYLFAIGEQTAAIGVLVWCAVVVGTADNILRPILVGRDTQMPDLLIFVSTLGGLFAYGAVGILIGPLLAALFLTVWEIYGIAFRSYLPD